MVRAMKNKAGHGASVTLEKDGVLFKVAGEAPQSPYLLHSPHHPPHYTFISKNALTYSIRMQTLGFLQSCILNT